MQVRYDEGVAIHIDLEPCAVACEGGSEASAEEHIGQPLSGRAGGGPGRGGSRDAQILVITDPNADRNKIEI